MIKKIITPHDEYHYFFGYYDLQPYDDEKSIHLTHRVPFCDRLPEAEDVAEIGYIRLSDNKFVKIADTRAWNFQQGALLQWFEKGKSVIFNDFDGEQYISRVISLSGEEISRFNRPIACLSADGKRAISINFSRIYDFRKGYGYCNIADEYAESAAPEDDGIFILDTESGESRLLFSYRDFKKAFDEEPFTNQKLVVNHVNFAPNGKKIIFLLRNFTGDAQKWGTVLAVGDIGGNLKQLTKFEVNSHYSWKDNKTLMIYSGLPEWGIYFIDTEDGKRTRLNNAICDKDDIHCNYSPDRKMFIGDGYPNEQQYRALYCYEFETKKAWEILSVYSMPVTVIDIRCDLHARWSADGTRISYDTTENRRREIVELLI